MHGAHLCSEVYYLFCNKPEVRQDPVNCTFLQPNCMLIDFLPILFIYNGSRGLPESSLFNSYYTEE